MKILFKIALYSILLYLSIDVGIRGEIKEGRPIVQAVGGLSTLLIVWYNISNIKRFTIGTNWRFITFWSYFIALLSIYYLFSFLNLPSDFVDTNPRNLVIAIYGFAVFVFFYYGVVNNHLSKKNLNIVLLIVIINGLFEIYYAVAFVAIKQGVEVINTSAGYIFVMILPLLMYRFRKDNIWIFIITLLLTMMTGKRGALVIYGVLFIYSIYNFKSIKNQIKLNWKVFLFLGIILFSYFFLMENAFESLENRMGNIVHKEKGTIGSGRDVIWSTLFLAWYNSQSFIYLIFGFGFYATSSIEGHIAHNDFVEFLVDFGLLGLSFYLLVLGKFYIAVKRIKKYNKYLSLLLVFCLIILLGRGMIAGTLRTDNIILSISMGYLLGIATIQRKYNEK